MDYGFLAEHTIAYLSFQVPVNIEDSVIIIMVW